MASPTTPEAYLELVRKAELADSATLNACLQSENGSGPPKTPREVADLLVRAGVLTRYQATLILKGSWESFRIGPYRILERLGFGATSNVYLCKHRATNTRVAVKVMAAAQAKDPVALKRFYREAKAGAPLDHPNIVRVRDVDWEDETNYLVMDFVDGSSVQDIVQHFGPMDTHRAAHYISQAAEGLQYAHEHGLVHRDIRPANLLIDRKGHAKILDMGLARFAEEGDMEQLTQGEVLGAPEYLAPEQALDSHKVDIRADIYSLGATLYFMLAGKAPYSEEKSPAGKLLSKQTRPPKALRAWRAEVPEGLVEVVEKMMAKGAAQRYQEPQEIVEALAQWGEGPIAPPPDQEMPQLSPAAQTDQARKASQAEVAPPELPAEEAPREVGGLVLGLVILLLAGGTFAIAWLLFGAAK